MLPSKAEYIRDAHEVADLLRVDPTLRVYKLARALGWGYTRVERVVDRARKILKA